MHPNNNASKGHFDNQQGRDPPPQPQQAATNTPLDQLPIGTGTSVRIDNISVEFPYDPYPLQVDYMATVIRALNGAQNALLESPTGTGKTLCLLCSALAWLLYQRKSSVRLRQQPSTQQALHQLQPKNPQQPLAVLTQTSTGVTTYRTNQTTQPPPSLDLTPPPTSFTIPSPAFEVAPAEKIRIIYAARTHSQLTQVVRELHKTSYGARIRVLAGRQHLCLNEAVRRQPQSLQRSECNKLVSNRSCQYRQRLDQFLSSQGNTILNEEMLDIEDIVVRAHEHRVCPYYWTRTGLEHADLILVPYQYVIDPVACSSIGLSSLLPNSILIFDEAHNLESTCTESSSLDLPISLLTGTMGELSAVKKKLEQKSMKSGTVSLALNLQIKIPAGTPIEKIQEYQAQDENETKIHLNAFIQAGQKNGLTAQPVYNPDGVLARNDNDDGKVQEAEFTFTTDSVETIQKHIQNLRHDILTLFHNPPQPSRQVPNGPFELSRNSATYMPYTSCRGSQSKDGVSGLVFYGSWLYNVLFRRFVFPESERKKHTYDHQTHPLLQTDLNYVQNNNTAHHAKEMVNGRMTESIKEDKRWIWSSSKDNSNPLPGYFDTILIMNSFLKQLEIMARWYIYGESKGPNVNGMVDIDEDQRDENGEIDISAVGPDLSKEISETRDRQQSCQILVLCEVLRTLFQRALSELYFHQLNYYFRCYIDFSPTFRESLRGKPEPLAGHDDDHIVLSLWCFSASVMMRQILENKIRSVVLTSGTLAPLSSYKSEMGIPFQHELENSHVVTGNQMAVHILTHGPEKLELTTKFTQRDSVAMWADLGKSISILSQGFRSSGVLAFFPSYALMTQAMKSWKTQSLGDSAPNDKTGYYQSSIFHRISVHHTVFFESRDSGGSDLNTMITRKRQEQFERDAKNNKNDSNSSAPFKPEPAKKTFGAPIIQQFLAKGAQQKGVSFKNQNAFGHGLGNSRAEAYRNADAVTQVVIREKMNFGESMTEFKRVIEHAQKLITQSPPPPLDSPQTRGAMLFGICRGKASEGIDFSDAQARAVFIVGIPYSSLTDPKVILKRAMLDGITAQQNAELNHLAALISTVGSRNIPPHLDHIFQSISDPTQRTELFTMKHREYTQRKSTLEQSQQLNGSTWYTQSALRAVNQAIGRVIRHRYDYGAVILADSRFSQDAHRQLLAKWIRDFVKVDEFRTTALSIRSFIKTAPTYIAETKKRNEERDEELRQAHLRQMFSQSQLSPSTQSPPALNKSTHPSDVKFLTYDRDQPAVMIDLTGSAQTSDSCKATANSASSTTNEMSDTTPRTQGDQNTPAQAFPPTEPQKRSRLGCLPGQLQNQSVTIYPTSQSTTGSKENKVSIDDEENALLQKSLRKVNPAKDPSCNSSSTNAANTSASSTSYLTNHHTSSQAPTSSFAAPTFSPSGHLAQPSDFEPLTQHSQLSQQSNPQISQSDPTTLKSQPLSTPKFTQDQLRSFYGALVWSMIRFYIPNPSRSLLVNASTAFMNKTSEHNRAAASGKDKAIIDQLFAEMQKAMQDTINILLDLPEVLPIQTPLFIPTPLTPQQLSAQFGDYENFCQTWTQIAPPHPIPIPQPPLTQRSAKPPTPPLSTPKDIAFVAIPTPVSKSKPSAPQPFPFRFRLNELHSALIYAPSGHINPALYISTPLFHQDQRISLAFNIANSRHDLPPLLELTNSQRIHISNLYRNPESLIQSKSVNLVAQPQHNPNEPPIMRPTNDNLLLTLNNYIPTPNFDFDAYIESGGKVSKLVTTPTSPTPPPQPQPFTPAPIQCHPIQHQSQLLALVLPRHCLTFAFLSSLKSEVYATFRTQLIKTQQQYQLNTEPSNRIPITRQDLNILPKPRFIDLMQQVRTCRSWYLDYFQTSFVCDTFDVIGESTRFLYRFLKQFFDLICPKLAAQNPSQPVLDFSLTNPTILELFTASVKKITPHAYCENFYEKQRQLKRHQLVRPTPPTSQPSQQTSQLQPQPPPQPREEQVRDEIKTTKINLSSVLQPQPQLQPASQSSAATLTASASIPSEQSNSSQVISRSPSDALNPTPSTSKPSTTLHHSQSASLSPIQSTSTPSIVQSNQTISQSKSFSHPDQPPQSDQSNQPPSAHNATDQPNGPQSAPALQPASNDPLRLAVVQELGLDTFRDVLSKINQSKSIPEPSDEDIAQISNSLIDFCTMSRQRNFSLMDKLIAKFEQFFRSHRIWSQIFTERIKPKLDQFLSDKLQQS